VVERSAVNRLVVGSNPTAGANRDFFLPVYCSKASRKRLVTRLKEADFVVDEKRDRDGPNGPYCAIVQRGNARSDDINWFKTALAAAAGINP
jgi:hypothetical protein